MTDLGLDKIRRSAPWVMVAAVFGAALLCYWPALHGAFLWDDPAHITSAELRSWEGLWRIWVELGATQQYYPVLHTAFWIEHRLWGDSEPGYHLANVFMHAGSCCLLAVLLRRLWFPAQTSPDDTAARNSSPGLEWLAALLFAVHPVCVESVAWISEQKNTLSLFFYLLAGLAYLRFSARRGLRHYLLATFLFLLALGTKSVTATLPAAILVVLWWRNGRLSWRRDIAPLIPWFAVAIGAGFFTAWVERNLVGADGGSFDLSFVQRVLLASHAVWFYLGKLVWPFDLSFFYPRWDVPDEAGGWIGYFAAAVAITAAAFWFCRKARGPLAAWMLFVGSLFPALGFFNVYPFIFSYVADHFQYLACMMFLSAAVGGLVWVTGKPIPGIRAGAWIFGLVLASGLMVLSREQSRLYRDVETLFRDTISKAPQSWMAHHNLGLALSRLPGGSDEAIAEFHKAIELNPKFPESHFALGRELVKESASRSQGIAEFEKALELRPLYSEALNALGMELAKQPGQLEEAISLFKKALVARPHLVSAHLSLANALSRNPADLPEAMAHFEEVLHIEPDYARGHNDYAQVLARLPGKTDAAIQQFETAIRLAPDFAEARCNLADLLASIPGRTADAIAQYELGLKYEPDSAKVHYGLANVLATAAGRPDEAIVHYEKAIQLLPGFAEAHANLANVLSHIPGRAREAISHYEDALRIDPKLEWVHFNLAMLLAQIPGHAGDAISHYREALRLKPNYTDAMNGLAILFAQQGRFDEARAEWMHALEIDPNYQTARQTFACWRKCSPRPTSSNVRSFQALNMLCAARSVVRR